MSVDVEISSVRAQVEITRRPSQRILTNFRLFKLIDATDIVNYVIFFMPKYPISMYIYIDSTINDQLRFDIPYDSCLMCDDLRDVLDFLNFRLLTRLKSVSTTLPI